MHFRLWKNQFHRPLITLQQLCNNDALWKYSPFSEVWGILWANWSQPRTPRSQMWLSNHSSAAILPQSHSQSYPALPGCFDSFGVFPWRNNIGQKLLLFLPDWIKAEEPADEGIALQNDKTRYKPAHKPARLPPLPGVHRDESHLWGWCPSCRCRQQPLLSWVSCSYGMVWVGTDLKSHLVPTPCHGSVPDCFMSLQPVLEHFQGWSIQTSLNNNLLKTSKHWWSKSGKVNALSFINTIAHFLTAPCAAKKLSGQITFSSGLPHHNGWQLSAELCAMVAVGSLKPHLQEPDFQQPQIYSNSVAEHYNSQHSFTQDWLGRSLVTNSFFF